MHSGRFDADSFHSAWDSVRIVRPVGYSLFTFGVSDLGYFLVLAPQSEGELVSVIRGEVKITRPLIITPDNAAPSLQNFFSDDDENSVASFLLARTASFSHLRLDNRRQHQQQVTDSVEEAVARLNRQLDQEDEDRVAILVAPAELGGFAVLKYAADRIIQSAPGNIQELREKGFLP